MRFVKILLDLQYVVQIMQKVTVDYVHTVIVVLVLLADVVETRLIMSVVHGVMFVVEEYAVHKDIVV